MLTVTHPLTVQLIRHGNSTTPPHFNVSLSSAALLLGVFKGPLKTCKVIEFASYLNVND